MQVTEIVLLNSPITLYAYPQDDIKRNTRVIIKTQSGEDIGATKNTINVKDEPEMVQILRVATTDDMKINCDNCRFARSLLPEIKKEVDRLKLDMKVTAIGTNFNRTKLEINYTADGRVDFRELIKILSSKYKLKIEMRQIGNRDETKMVGALGMCGRITCCKSFLNDFDKVSIKMAKNQNISLNPTKINGMCGRLLCCLKYEDDFYEEMQKKMPKIGSKVTTPDGTGIVSATDFLKEKVSVAFTKDETTEVKIFDLTDINFLSKQKDNN